MIIEAGYDLHQIISPYMHSRKNPWGLWLISMDQDLRFLRIRKVDGDFGESVAPHLDRIAKKLVGESFSLQPRYFAIAHRREHVHDNQTDEWVYSDDELVRGDPRLSAYRYLGRMVFDGSWVYSSWPRYSFRDYIGCEDLPRVAAIHGPHAWDCSCVACTQFNERIDRAREVRALEEAVDTAFTDET